MSVLVILRPVSLILPVVRLSMTLLLLISVLVILRPVSWLLPVTRLSMTLLLIHDDIKLVVPPRRLSWTIMKRMWMLITIM